MKNYYKSWIIFLGFDERNYADLLYEITMYQNYVAEHGICMKSLEEFRNHIFSHSTGSETIAPYSCCMDSKTMYVKQNDIRGNWVDRGGLHHLPELVKREHMPDKYEINDSGINNMFLSAAFSLIGIAMDGTIVIDLTKEYGNMGNKHNYINQHGIECFLSEMLAMIKENIRPMPEVPKGILSLPEQLEEEA